ncbi:MAG: CBS domain-containing protein [candidate division Zixibacteria bacterium]|nr:CBS domain-containing protein [candidate division Zixibacteria bacterium]
MKVKDLLADKGSAVYSVPPDKTLKEALHSMLENKVGCLLVVLGDEVPVGIITERDILRFVAKAINWHDTLIKEIMTSNLVIGFPDDDLEVIMALMTQNYFRHVPILDNKRLAGIVSIGDIIKTQLMNIKAENRYLNEYIAGKYPA